MDEFIRNHGHHLLTGLCVFIYMKTGGHDPMTAAVLATIVDLLAEVYFMGHRLFQTQSVMVVEPKS